jgi:hypothetical protein
MSNAARTFFALWYLLGWVSHVYLALWSPETYRPFGDTALLPQFRRLWRRVIMPHIRIFALLLAAFELITGLLMVTKGRLARLGLALSVTFNLFLVQLGLAWEAPGARRDFVANRLPSLLFVIGQLPLLRTRFDRSLVQVVRDRIGAAAA